MRATVAILLLSSTTTVPLLAARASAQEGAGASEADDDVTRAIALGREGKVHYDAGRYAEALHDFEAADALAHSPVFVLYAARCEKKLGRWRAAAKRLRHAAAETVGESAPAAWREAVQDARAEADALEAEMPMVTIVGAPGRDEAILLDGEPYPGGRVPVDPGPHEVVVPRAGDARVERRIEVEAGSDVVVDIPPPAPITAPQGQPALPLPRSTPSVDGPASESISPWRVGGYTAIGIGGAALVTGAVTGGLALARAADARDECGSDGICDGDDSRRAGAERLAHVSTAMLVLGGVAVVTGVTLLVVPLDDSPGTTTALTVRPLAVDFAWRF